MRVSLFGLEFGSLAISELVSMFLDASKTRWKQGYNRASTFDRYEYALQLFSGMYENVQANKIQKKQILAFRNKMADTPNINKPERPKTRRYVNNQLLCVRELFRWGGRQGLITDTTLERVLSVPVIRKGDTGLAESRTVTSVSLETVETTIRYMHPFVADMVRVHYLSGMRSGELCSIRPCDISEEGNLLKYTPSSHKTDYLGKGRVIYLGPRVRTIIQKYLDACQSQEEFLWSPRKTMMAMRKKSKNSHPDRWRASNRYWTPVYYGHVFRAIRRANVEAWHPHQLRHLFATLAAKEFGCDSIMESLGHTSIKMTQIYIDRGYDKAKLIAEKLG